MTLPRKKNKPTIEPKKFEPQVKPEPVETLADTIHLEELIEMNEKGGVTISRPSELSRRIANLGLLKMSPTYPDGIYYDNNQKVWKTTNVMAYLTSEVLGKQLSRTLIESKMTPNVKTTYAKDILDNVKLLDTDKDDPFNLSDATTPEIRNLINLVPFKNGTYDFRTNEVRPHDQKDYIIAPFSYNLVPYDIEKETPDSIKWLEFLTGDSYQTLCEYIGYSFVRTYSLINAFLIATDDKTNPDGSNGRNGKSATFSIIQKLLHSAIPNVSNTTAISLEELTKASSNAYVMSDLRGKYASFDADASSKYLDDTSKLKKLTGGDVIRSDVKYQSAVEFKTHAKLFFGMNNLPRFSDDSDGFKERLLVIPFGRDLRKKEDRDKANKLFNYQNPTDEDLGKLAWFCIQQFRKLSFKDGQLKTFENFTQTETSLKVKENWREQNDQFVDFWGEMYELTTNENDYVNSKDLHDALGDYLKENGYKTQTLASRKAYLKHTLNVKAYKGNPNDGKLVKKIDGKSERIYRGVKLVDAPKNEPDNNEDIPF